MMRAFFSCLAMLAMSAAAVSPAVAQGLFGPVTGVVQELTGRTPEGVASFVARNKEALLALDDRKGV